MRNNLQAEVLNFSISKGEGVNVIIVKGRDVILFGRKFGIINEKKLEIINIFEYK